MHIDMRAAAQLYYAENPKRSVESAHVIVAWAYQQGLIGGDLFYQVSMQPNVWIYQKDVVC